MNIYNYFVESWSQKKHTLNSLEEILDWIELKKKSTTVNINKIPLSNCTSWFMDHKLGVIRNEKNCFFQIIGVQHILNGKTILEQPIILQDEIGYLGIITKIFNGVLYFLMQAKIEPGNLNNVQISPTIQATKSNFYQKHGGNKPPYLEYFLNLSGSRVIVDQLQSEQSSRFYKKRNRNMIILVEKEIEVLKSHIWMTLGQLKQLLKINNLVNMDTRTVISSIPFYKANIDQTYFNDKYLYNSLFNTDQVNIAEVYNKINNYKMFDNSIITLKPLSNLVGWNIYDHEISSKEFNEFKIVFCDIEIEGREVKKWNQPLVEALEKYSFVLFTKTTNDKRLFMVKLTSEIGCFDKIELGPSLQTKYSCYTHNLDVVHTLFTEKLKSYSNILYDVYLSEEGGRFFHEENRNLIIEINDDDITDLSNNYIWLDYKTLLHLIEFNNVVNIQLRNLLSLLEV